MRYIKMKIFYEKNPHHICNTQDISDQCRYKLTKRIFGDFKLVDIKSIWNLLVVKEGGFWHKVTFGFWRHLETLSWLRERDLCTFGNTLLKIAMTHPLSGLRVWTLTKYSDDIYPKACLGRTPPTTTKPTKLGHTR